VVVAEERKGKLSVDNAGAGGVMVVFVASFGLCYGSASVAVTTRLFYVKKGIIVKGITFLFGTCVTENK